MQRRIDDRHVELDDADGVNGQAGAPTLEELTASIESAYPNRLVEVAHKELKKNGLFILHGFAKFVVVKKPARPARKGINPFTKQEQTFAAKPASKAVRALP